jgi:hypothetical protein
LGEITSILNGSSGLWQIADNQFGGRIDYRLWRVFFSKSSTRYSTPVHCGEILAQLNNGNPEIVWGLIVLLPSLFNNYERKAVFSPQEWSQFFGACSALFINGIKPIQGGEQACHLAELLMIGAMQSYNWETRPKEISCAEAMRILETFTAVLRKIDPGWQPGDNLTTRGILRESRAVLSSEPVASLSLIPQKLYYAGNMARRVAHRMQGISQETDALLNQAALFCLTAWRYSRDMRKGEEKWRADKDPNTLNLDVDRILHRELKALHEAAHAAWDAGHYLNFPVLAHLYLWSADLNPQNHEFNRKIAKHFAKWIHQLGLEVPPSFTYKHKPQAPNLISQSRNDNPYWWRLALDQENNHNWRTLKDNYSEWKQFLPERGEPNADPWFYDPFQLFKSLSFAIGSGAYSNPAVARSAFSLALKYGWTGLAEKLIGGFPATRRELLDFCHHLKRIQQICPFGIDDSDDQHRAWRRVLKTSWAALPPDDSLNSEELLATHEVLVGRTVELLRWKGKSTAPVLIKKYNDLASEDEIRAAVSDNSSVFSPGVATISANRVVGLMQAVSKSALGSCVCVSIVRLPGDKLSFLAVDQSCGSQANWVVETEPFPGLEDELQALNDTRDDWLKIGGQNSFEPPIDWDEQ